MASQTGNQASEPGFLSEAARRIKPSASNAASQRARELSASGRSIVDLTTGEPDFATPAHICEAAIAAMQAGQTRYTTVDGTLQLKQAITQKFLRDNELEYTPQEISVAAGAKQIIFNALLATLNPGDEVVIPLPCWVSYVEMVTFAGGKAVTIAPRPGGFDTLLQEVEKSITPRTKWLMINSPNNPSGVVYTRDQLRALADLLLRHPHVWVLTDDIYEHIVFDGRRFFTLAQVEPRLKARTLTVNGVSKAYSMTGWRIGYAGGPQPLIRAMAKIQSQSTSAPCSISQAAAVAALDGPQDLVHERARIFQHRRDLLLKEFETIPGIRPNAPEGAFYLFLDCAGLMGKRTPQGQTLASDQDLVEYFLEHAGVAMVHGTPFGAPGHLRLSFAASEANLTEACRRLRQACSQL